jgi:hypothetical protein
MERYPSISWLRPGVAHEDVLRFLSDAAQHRVLTLEREPHLWRSHLPEGEKSACLVGRTPPKQDTEAVHNPNLTQDICAYAAIHFRETYLNSSASTVTLGYLNSLTVSHNSVSVLRDGFKKIRKLLVDEQPKTILTTILESNDRAKRTIGSGRALFGVKYSSLGRYHTAIFSPRKHRDTPSRHLSWRQEDPPSEFTKRVGPLWNGATIKASFGDWERAGVVRIPIVVLRDGEVAASGSLVNFNAIRRWRYNPSALSLPKRLLFTLAPYVSSVPRTDQLDKLIYIHSVLCHPSDTEALMYLFSTLQHVATQKISKNVALCFGTHERSPLYEGIRRIPHHKLSSILYQVNFPGLTTSSCDSLCWNLDVGGL